MGVISSEMLGRVETRWNLLGKEGAGSVCSAWVSKFSLDARLTLAQRAKICDFGGFVRLRVERG